MKYIIHLRRGADIVVLSLSKHYSNGSVICGAILGNNIDKIK